ncbi:MAG: hypothetical protein B6D55_03095 [Candidatus Omnitrophica bacterium 4484_70.2]|nr:MAG: hypothetical protein B6D55_03095 [Candidatus Omnitrophica bacterium 4484_70.2]
MDLFKSDLESSILYIILFVIPGFIINEIISLLQPSVREELRRPSIFSLRAITFSCINYAIFLWLIIIWYRYSTYLWLSVIVSIIVLILGPIIIGFVFSKIIEKSFLRIRLTSTAWDYYFSQEKPCWVLVTLKDGSRIGGRFFKDSFVSSPPFDLYIEETWKINKEGGFKERVNGTKGFIVKYEDIKCIEFFEKKGTGGENG